MTVQAIRRHSQRDSPKEIIKVFKQRAEDEDAPAKTLEMLMFRAQRMECLWGVMAHW